MFLACLERMRVKFGAFVYGYVVMPVVYQALPRLDALNRAVLATKRV